MLCDSCKRCIYHNVKWPKECEWSPYSQDIGVEKKEYDIHGKNKVCVLLVEE